MIPQDQGSGRTVGLAHPQPSQAVNREIYHLQEKQHTVKYYCFACRETRRSERTNLRFSGSRKMNDSIGAGGSS